MSGVLFSHKKNKTMSCMGKSMELEDMILSGVSQVQKEPVNNSSKRYMYAQKQT
jgi:hypothetical protein